MVVYLILRGVIALVVAGLLGHTFPRFPLYLPVAVVVEAVAALVGTDRRLRFALVAGALVGTLGLAGELAFVAISGYGPVAGSLLLRTVLLAAPMAFAAAILGAGISQASSPGRPACRPASPAPSSCCSPRS